LRIAANALIDRAPGQGREPAAVDLEPASEPERLDAEARARLYAAVAELLPDQRRVIELRFAEERSIKEIATALGRTEGAVKQLQLRALAALRKRIGEEADA
jgi:RNA polymerase sigma-70 factor (ECF subfamily)